MNIHKYSIVALMAAALPAIAQQTRCSTGPGSVFGVAAYNCANCGYKFETGHRPIYTFFSEPVVTEVDNSTGVASGDVVEAVDDVPITTQAGADLFTNPGRGEHTLRVRRGRDHQLIKISLASTCYSISTSTNSGNTTTNTTTNWVTRLAGARSARGDTIHFGTGVGTGSSASSSSGGTSSRTSSGGGRGVGVPVIGGEPLYIIDGVVQPPAKATAGQIGKFGFAVECHPSCSFKRTANGKFYYKYDGYPAISAIRDSSAASRAGLKVGDLVVKVNGHSILDDMYDDFSNDDSLRLTVRRDGKDFEVLMVVSGS